MNETEIKLACIDRINECFDKVEAMTGSKLWRPIVVFKKRGRTAGTASYRRDDSSYGKIDLNMGIAKAQPEDFIRRTPGHEAAHLIAVQLYGFDKGKGHGPAWKKVMRAIGQAPERCHSYDVSGVVKGHAYKCSSCGKDFHLTTHRHNKILRGSTYHCTATSACRSSRLVKA
jgi:SprT protein